MDLKSNVRECLSLLDVERGIPEEELRQPLLNVQEQNEKHNGRHLPKPFKFPPHSNGHSQFPPPLDSPNSTQSTPGNTPASTPANEHPEAFPKKWRRSDRRLRRLNTELLEAIETQDNVEVERLLNKGANPNATCRLSLVSACHVAALVKSDSLALLVKFGAEIHRQDKLGRTPLHLAAWAGNPKQMAILLNIPENIQQKIDSNTITNDVEADIRKLCSKTRDLANARSDLGESKGYLPKTWRDNIDHACMDINGSLPVIRPGWTPLHISSALAHIHCTRLLVAAGADPNIEDELGSTTLDVIGSGIYYDKEVDKINFSETIRLLVSLGGKFNTMSARGIKNVDTPLHTAAFLDCTEAISGLLDAGSSVSCLNAAGQTPLHVCVKKQLEETLQLLANYGNNDEDPLLAVVDVRDADGHTVLQAAVESAWVPGVCIALEAGADVTLKANDGETSIHSAAALGNLDVLNEILSVAKQKDSIDNRNDKGETPLHKAIFNGHLECVKSILNEGASYKITLPGNVNVLHKAAEYGHDEILKELLNHNENETKDMINELTDGGKKGFAPIHFAVANNHIKCVDTLISKNADIRLRTTCSPHKSSTPLHLAALKNNVEIAKLILKYDSTTLHEVNSMGWFPLHTAGHHGSRDVIQTLLREGADLSGYTDGPKKYKKTAIDMIINNLSKPTEFLECIFDSYIESNCKNFLESNCEITVDYRVLMPRVCETEQMKVIEALLKTGNRYGQERLLVHPLTESFLCLKWKALLPFFYTIIFMYGLFVASLTIFIVSIFFYKDTKEDMPVWLDTNIWGYIVYSSIILVLLQELLYMNVKSSRYFLQLETWVKFTSISLALILPTALSLSWLASTEWPRHMATIALLSAWLEMMFLLSRFPNWGYYVLMFGKVASNVIKILLTFAFLVIGFSLSFMIQFRSQMPFEGPWAAIVKTMVMMTSEFDYEALFDEEHTENLATSIQIIRFIFVIFLVLAAIVLMNLMVGVAVNDINDLEVLGNIRRLAKQVEFLATLDVLVYNKLFNKALPKSVNNSIKNKRKVTNQLVLCPGKPRWRSYKLLPSRIRDSILNKAEQQVVQQDNEMGFKLFNLKLDEMHDIIVKNKNLDTLKIQDDENKSKTKDFDDVQKHGAQIDDSVAKTVESLNVKMDEMSLEIQSIKQFLTKLEKKLNI